MDKVVSVVIPAYNEEQMIAKTAAVIGDILKKADIPYELVFVDDGSKDRTWDILSEIAETVPEVVGIHFSRNFGKEAAIIAGLSESTGDCCVVIDCDLQHPPEKIVEMVDLWKQGYEVIEGQKSSRGKESGLHAAAAKSFYSLISKASHINMANASDFKLLDRKAVNVLIDLPEKNAFFRALSSWIGFKTATVTFDVQERTAGESKWSTGSLIKYAISNISSFSSVPMYIVTVLGVVMLLVSLVFTGISLAQYFTGTALGGFTTVIALLLFSSSIIMISLGIIGYYLSRIYDEVKGRPRYIIADICGKKKQ